MYIKNQVTFVTKVICEIDENNQITPVGSEEYVEDSVGRKLDMIEYPQNYKIMISWLGKMFGTNYKGIKDER